MVVMDEVESMTMENEELIIKKIGSGWSVRLTKNRRPGSLILTNQRLIVADNSIPLEDIVSVDIDTRTADVTRIVINLENKTEYLDFARHSAGHMVNILFGDTGWSHSEVSSYTSYWASLLTMATFLFGRKNKYVKSHANEYEGKAWCHNCGKYVTIKRTETPIWQIECPECGRKPLASLSPEDRKKDKFERYRGRTL